MTAHLPSTAPPPKTVTTAYWLYVVGAVLGLIGAIVSFIALPAVLQQAIDQANRSLQGRDTGGIDVTGLATGSVITGVVIGAVVTLAFTVLTIVFAVKFRQGRNWARIVLAVFAALQIFGVLGTYGIGAVHFLVVLAALILSFVTPSNVWFREMRPRPATAY